MNSYMFNCVTWHIGYVKNVSFPLLRYKLKLLLFIIKHKNHAYLHTINLVYDLSLNIRKN